MKNEPQIQFVGVWDSLWPVQRINTHILAEVHMEMKL
jgi:hypothetical protein